MSLFKSKSKKSEPTPETKTDKPSMAMAFNMQRQAKKKKMALGGQVDDNKDIYPNEKDLLGTQEVTGRPQPQPPKMYDKAPHPAMLSGAEESAVHSMVSEIMKRRKMAEGGLVDDESTEASKRSTKLDFSDDEGAHPLQDDMDHMADGGMVDIEENGEEEPNAFYERNREALKENYDDDMEDVTEPSDSNEHGDKLSDEDEHDGSMVDKLRKKAMAKRLG
jgi:hypothetical protein